MALYHLTAGFFLDGEANVKKKKDFLYFMLEVASRQSWIPGSDEAAVEDKYRSFP
ncbi:hypothetical protein Dimus_010676, partial [Dionaea muscipula]